MDYHPGKHKCVEYGTAAGLAKRSDFKSVQVTMHELAHAYHDQVLGFDDPDVLAAHKRAREEGKYPERDWVVRANHKEFFAGLTTRYFESQERRKEIVERDPIFAKKLEEYWGQPKALMHDPLLDSAVATLENMTAGEKLPIKIYFMAGQSNMVGHLSASYVQEHHPDLMTPRDDVFCARAGRVSGPLQPGYGSREHSCGMELMMGKVLGDAVPNPILFVKSCTGGTTLHHDWRPPSAVKRAGGEIGPLYTRMMRRWHNVLANLDLHVPDGSERGFEVAGFVWFQGENDCCRKDDSGTGYWEFYEENLEDLLRDVRSDLGVPELPVLVVQINDGCWDGLPGRGGTVLRPVQQKVAEADPHATWIKTCDLNQGYHYDAASHITIGQRGGLAMLPFAKIPVPQTPEEIHAGRKRFFTRQLKPGNADTRPLSKGLIGYWKFDEGAGAQTADSSTSSNVGAIKGNPEWTEGLFGKAVELIGRRRIEIPGFKEPTGPGGNIENLSVSYWVRTNRFGDARVGRGTGTPIEKRTDHNWFLSDTANESGWDICAHDCDYCGLATAAFDNGPKTVMSDRPAHLVGDGVEWHHVVITYEGKNKCFRIFVDADPFDERRSRESLAGIEEANHILPAGQDVPMTLGGLIDHDGQFQIFDELAIWQRAITPDEVATLYNNGFGAEINSGNVKE
jgi:hypothetical protein